MVLLNIIANNPLPPYVNQNVYTNSYDRFTNFPDLNSSFVLYILQLLTVIKGALYARPIYLHD